MAQFLIHGRQKLHGEITANPSKNYILPVMAAALLTEEPCILRNVPSILDVEYMLKILNHLGSEVTWLDNHTIQIQTKHISQTDIPVDLAKKLRASVLALGPLLSRAHQAAMHHPGGDVIGRRSIDSHLLGFSQLGAKIEQTHEQYHISATNLAGNVIFDEISVTATENVLLAAAGSHHEIVLHHAALEPHVQELCSVLEKMGVSVKGKGSNTVSIKGSKELKGFDHTFGSDHIEVGTWAVLAGVTHSPIAIKNVNPEYLDMILLVLDRIGVHYRWADQDQPEGLTLPYQPKTLHVTADALQSVTKIDAFPWPGFPTDLISMMIVLATQAHGVTLIRDWMYEGRMFFVDKLITMGASIVLCDPHRVIISGPAHLHGKQLESPDIRAGMALVLAALAAEGESVISNIQHIERDYENVAGRLQQLGAAIERID